MSTISPRSTAGISPLTKGPFDLVCSLGRRSTNYTIAVIGTSASGSSQIKDQINITVQVNETRRRVKFPSGLRTPISLL